MTEQVRQYKKTDGSIASYFGITIPGCFPLYRVESGKLKGWHFQLSQLTSDDGREPVVEQSEQDMDWGRLAFNDFCDETAFESEEGDYTAFITSIEKHLPSLCDIDTVIRECIEAVEKSKTDREGRFYEPVEALEKLLNNDNTFIG